MKKVFLKLVIIIGIFAVNVPHTFSQNIAEKGNGNVVALERTIGSFGKIKCKGSIEMRFHVSEKYRAVVVVDSNLEKYIAVSTEDNVLNISNKNNGMYAGNAFTKCSIDIYCPNLTDISISGSGSFNSVDRIASSSFTAEISGSGSIGGTFDCENFAAKISGSGSISATGSAKDVVVSISGSGNFRGIDFDTRDATVTIGGSGKATIGVSDNLNATLFGKGSGGQIAYRGNPKILSNIKGNGRIIKI